MGLDFNPYSKEQQLAGHKKREKDTPKFKPRRPHKRKKQKSKVEVYKGRKIPSRGVRGRITTKEYNEALRKHGEFCYVCGCSSGLEAHHIRFRSAGGRGVWRNIRFLCADHHRGDYSPHQNIELRKQLEELHRDLYGEHFYKDVYDLYKEGLIPNTTQAAYISFMESEEDRLYG